MGILKIAQWLAEGTREQLIREFAELQVYDSSVLTEELLRERTVAASDPEILATNAATNMLPGDLNPDMPKITAPTLLLWGREDNFIPLEMGAQRATVHPQRRATGDPVLWALDAVRAPRLLQCRCARTSAEASARLLAIPPPQTAQLHEAGSVVECAGPVAQDPGVCLRVDLVQVVAGVGQ
ncbi:MAG TPA: hypothetical protein VE485_09125 [Mycobacterium sp.]|nr:hypothetical protein [Mycobacterium sp.]